MEFSHIISVIICFATFVFAAKYDIHMFQLNSYRYNRYMRWLWPSNVLTHCKWLLLAVSAFASINLKMTFTHDNAQIRLFLVIIPAIAYIIYEIKANKNYKTPLVFTGRIKRLSATTLLLYIAIVSATWIFAEEHTVAVSGAIIFFSNAVVMLANLFNTPLEKAINRHYYNDAKKIIESHKGLIVIGVTGSFGKTSTKNYLASILAEKYNVLVTPGNFNTLLGVVRTIREHLRPFHQVFIVEMGAKQPGDIKEICDLVHPTIGIVTAIGEMHLETFKCVENIQKTKFELIDSLPTDGLGVLNIDSALLLSYNGKTSNCKKITYAIENQADLRAIDVKYSGNGVSFTLSTNEERYESRLLGTGNLLNILGSIAIANHLEVPVQKQKNAIARLQPVEHRLSMRRSGGITILDDAYNSNPMGARMALEVLRNFDVAEGNKRIIITPGFVEMGSKQYEANRQLGKDIARSCDYAVIVNATNREAIVTGIVEYSNKKANIFLADSLNHAHAHLAGILKMGDIILYENDLPDNFK